MEAVWSLDYAPAVCSGCGADLAGAPATAVQQLQVFDIAPATAAEASHRQSRCGAGRQAHWLDERHQDLIHDLGEQLIGSR